MSPTICDTREAPTARDITPADSNRLSEAPDSIKAFRHIQPFEPIPIGP